MKKNFDLGAKTATSAGQYLTDKAARAAKGPGPRTTTILK